MLDRGYLCILVFLIHLISQVINNEDESSHQHIPFFIMQPHTVINQTLHSYCKEQVDFNSQPMLINLTEWPSGFIYARNPYENSDPTADYDQKPISLQECTLELRASVGDRIRLVFYPIRTLLDDYDQDYDAPIPKVPCLKIRDMDETVIVDCPLLFDRTKSIQYHQSEDHLSNSDVIYLELIPPSTLISNNQRLTYHQFKLFFTLFTPKVQIGSEKNFLVCPQEYLIDCDDPYCVHSSARCNGINDCRSRIDEESCTTPVTTNGHAISTNSHSLLILNLIYFCLDLVLSLF